MTKDITPQQSQLNLSVVALVALVAIIGLVALVFNAPAFTSSAQYVQPSIESADTVNAAGQIYRRDAYDSSGPNSCTDDGDCEPDERCLRGVCRHYRLSH